MSTIEVHVAIVRDAAAQPARMRQRWIDARVRDSTRAPATTNTPANAAISRRSTGTVRNGADRPRANVANQVNEAEARGWRGEQEANNGVLEAITRKISDFGAAQARTRIVHLGIPAARS